MRRKEEIRGGRKVEEDKGSEEREMKKEGEEEEECKDHFTGSLLLQLEPQVGEQQRLTPKSKQLKEEWK